MVNKEFSEIASIGLFLLLHRHIVRVWNYCHAPLDGASHETHASPRELGSKENFC